MHSLTIRGNTNIQYWPEDYTFGAINFGNVSIQLTMQCMNNTFAFFIVYLLSRGFLNVNCVGFISFPCQ